MNALEPLWNLALANSARATLLIACIFLLRAVFKRPIPARFFPWLWLLVAVRLLIPVAPSSSASIYNLVSSSPRPTEESPRWTVRKDPAATVAPEATQTALTPPEATSRNVNPHRWPLLPLLWLGGVCVQVALLGRSAYRMRRDLKAAIPVSNPRVLAIAFRCAENLRLRRMVPLFETDAVGGPAIVGLWRPRLLIPRGLANELSYEELHYVLLHECAHLRRHDLAAVWLLVIARIVHWFNPFVWLAVRTAREDAEVACDEVVLRHSEEDAPQGYGVALLRLARLVPWQPANHPAAGMFQGRTTLGARVATISRYSPVAPWRSVAAAVLVLSVAMVFGADETKATPQSLTATDVTNLPNWAKGLRVVRLTLPELGESTPGEVELETGDGRRFVPNTGRPVNDDPWIESLTPGTDGSGWKVALRRNSETAVLTISDEVILRPGNAAGVQVEFETRFFETTDTSILRLQSHAPGVELLRSAVRRDPQQLVLSAAQAADLVRGLQAGNDMTVLSTPRVSTNPGQRAVIEIIREFRYPSEFKRDAEDKVWIPTAFETRNTGVTVEVEPTVDLDGRIRFHIVAQAVEPLGSRNEATGKGFPIGGPKRRQLDPRFSSNSFQVLDPANLRALLKMVFSTRKREATVALMPGESLLFTSMPETEDVAPLVSPAKTHRLISMITARLVKPQQGKIEAGAPAPGDVGPPDASPAEGQAPPAGVATAALRGIVRPEDKPGFIRSPYAPESGAIDVRGFPPGTKVKCPYTGKHFLVP